MNSVTGPESELIFDFHAPFEKADKAKCQGLSAVDYIVEDDEHLYFIELKNYEQSRAPAKNKEADYRRLTDKDAALPMEIGMKIKDSLLKRYAQAKPFSKKNIFILVIKFSAFSSDERLRF